MNKKFSVAVIVLLLATMASAVSAQVSYTDPWFSSYQVANLGTVATEIIVNYYDDAGAAAGQLTYPAVPAGGSVTVQQALEPTGGLSTNGRFSAVISAGEPIAAVANQQLGADGDGSSIPPFSSYSGASAGAQAVTLPSIMYNWYNYYTEVTIQNVGTAAATNITIEYFPTNLGGCVTGASGQTSVAASATAPLAQYASTTVSQFALSNLGGSNSCAHDGRFLGSAKITADQPVVVVVNEQVQGKLFTYNGIATGADTLLIPAYMRDYYGYYVALVIANPGSVAATVDITYTNGANGTTPGDVVTGQHTIPAGENITIYDGPGTDVTDLSPTYPNDDGGATKFFGTALIKSNQPVVAMVNQESVAASGAQAGTYNGMAVTEGSQKISVPLIQSDFYGYYTSLTIMTVDGTEANLEITYTSDGTYSAVQNHSETYAVTTSGGFLNRYEGSSATAAQSDLLDDTAWESGGSGRFIGSAVIQVTGGGPNIVAFVNSESGTAAGAGTTDSMYTYNAFAQ